MKTTFVRGSVSVRIFAALAMILAALPSARAQVLYGSIVGTVSDRSGAVIPNATVTVASATTGQVKQLNTSEDGGYSATDLLPGTYVVTIAVAGFRTSKTGALQVNSNTVTRVDMQLEVGERAEIVDVTAEATPLQTDQADVHVSLSTRAVTQLPLPAYRNYQALLNLVPGAAPVAYQNAVSGSPGRALATNINGTNNSANNTRLDGASNMRASLPAQNLYVPPSESIEVVNVATNSFDAEQGFAGGAAINVITKSGTNMFHGVVFEHHIDSGLKARNFFDLSAKPAKDIINNYGGAIGGPIRKNKLFFFASWEGMRERMNFTKITTVPTDAMRAGDFSGYKVTLYDPLTGSPDGSGRTAFVNNIIPSNRLSPIAQQIQALIPKPNLAGTTSNYFDSAPVSFNRDNIDAKVNWNRSDKTSYWGKYSVMKALVTSQFSLGQAGGVGMINGGGAGTGNVLMQVAAIGGVHTFSPTFLVDGNIAVSRDPLTLVGPDSGKNFGLDVFHIPGTNGPGIRYSGLPMFQVGGFETFGNAETYLPKYIRSTYFTYTLNFGWNKGKHDIRFGADFARYRVNEWHPELGGGPRGQFNFDGTLTTLKGGAAANQFNNWAAFVMGMPHDVNKSVQPDWSSPRQWMDGFYFRDRWQVTRSLTVTMGLRYEFYPLMTRAHSGIERYDPTTNLVYLGGYGSVPADAGISVSHKLFAPRLGLAYRLGQNTVIRSGFGISIDPYVLSTAQAYLFDYPVAINQSFSAANTYTAYNTLDQGIPAIVYPDVSSGAVKIPSVTTTITLPNGQYRRGYFESFNFFVERQLPFRFVSSAGYVGTRTIRQGIDLNINAAPPGTGQAGRPLNVLFGRTADTTVFTPMGGANYNALQAQMDRTLTAGMLVKVSYTYSKAIDLTDGAGGTLLFYDPANIGRNRALAGFDRTHIFRTAFVADLPFGRGKHWVTNPGIARAIVSGWQANGIFSAYSGTPFTVTASSGSLNAPGQSQTADQILPTVQKLGGIGVNSPYYDPSAFAPVTLARYGTSGRNILRGPGLVNLDGSLFRNFQVTERWAVQFRAEAFNLSNTPHFNNPSANVSSGGFMTITSALTSANNVEGGERVLRFALRISF
jgi:hypothetical protein